MQVISENTAGKKNLRLTIQKISNINRKLNFCGIIYTLKVLIHREGFEN